jgi:intergrase/recombinase
VTPTHGKQSRKKTKAIRSMIKALTKKETIVDKMTAKLTRPQIYMEHNGNTCLFYILHINYTRTIEPPNTTHMGIGCSHNSINEDVGSRFL